MPRENIDVNMHTEIKTVIQNTVRDFVNGADISDFLTEDDLRCHLFAELKTALAEYDSASLHAEVRWYGSRNPEGEKQLLYRSDIVVIDKETLDNPIGEDIFNIPSKGYAFDSYFAIIELKLRRPNNRDSNAKYQQVVEDDINKLIHIKDRTSLSHNPIFLSVVFDKKRQAKHVLKLRANNNTELLLDL
jgi:hypothetical protein